MASPTFPYSIHCIVLGLLSFLKNIYISIFSMKLLRLVIS